MENYPLLVPLIILIPSIGAFICLFFGARLTERAVGLTATIAISLSFLIAFLLYVYLRDSNYQAVVIDPPLLNGWIRIGSAGIEIPWQMRVDTLSVTMMLVITGVGSLIHVYSMSYMSGDPRYHRYFAYLNMFVAFMLVLVAGNNFVMLFVGWEGVGLCSFLLIGFWFDRPGGVGWKNSLAARKAFVLNRVGDFGVLMSVFLTFWTFGTLDFYRPQEVVNPEFVEHLAHEQEEEATSTTEAVAEEEADEAEGEHKRFAFMLQEGEGEGEGVVEGEAGETAEGELHAVGGEVAPVYLNNDHIPTNQLGVFEQAERFAEEGRQIDIGPLSLSIEQMLTLITLFMLLGAAGKSAQIPLFVWLPDAMAGPTPASALIHAATMVTAGVYLMVRSNVFFHIAEVSSFVVTIVGAGTAIVAGYIAIGQWDIKRVLAYSTVSQLGFMVAAVGVGAYSAAMFHLVTHAFFKALLFLGSGSVIHAIEHGHHHLHAHSGGHGTEAHDDAVHDSHITHANAHGDVEPHDSPVGAIADAAGHGVVLTEAEAHSEAAPAVHDDTFDPQDMRNMGGLRRTMPITYITYLAGTLALAGIIPFAGFWSKDEILADSWLAGLLDNQIGGYIAFVVLLIAAAFTAFYMWRQVTLVFHGRARTEAAEHAPESAPMMTIPLIVLAFFSLFVGFINTPENVLGLDRIFGAHPFTFWLESSVRYAHAAEFQPIIAILALGLAIAAMVLAARIYGRDRLLETRRDPLERIPATAPVFAFANARMYWDQFYSRAFEQPFNRGARFLADVVDWAFLHDYVHDTVIWKGFNAVGRFLATGVDINIIDGVVNGVGRLTQFISRRMRVVQTGYVRVYAITLLLGVVFVLIVLLLPLLQRG